MNSETATSSPDLTNVRTFALTALVIAAAALWSGSGQAQDELPTEPLTPQELEELVGPIALYPDDIVAIILPASTYPLEIVQAARFLEDRETNPALQPDPEWDDSIVALLNYPDVVRLMNDDLDWTWDLGEAVLDDEAAVLDAIQAFRDRAWDAGNLYSDDRQIVTEDEGVITIEPADPEVVYIPYYEPASVVVYQPRPVFHYYPFAYPLYYYPYPVGYRFRTGFFWGVTSAFLVGWHSHHIHVHHHRHYDHPYFSWSYYTPYYSRSNVYVTVNVNNYRNVWRPRYRRGARPYDGYRVSRSTGGQRVYDGRRYRYSDADSVRRSTLRDQRGEPVVDGTRTRTSTSTRRPATGGNTRGAATRPQRPARVATNNRDSAQNQQNRQARIGSTATGQRQLRGTGTSAARDPRMQSSGSARTMPNRSNNGTTNRGNDTRLAAPSTTRSTPNRTVTARPAPSRQPAPIRSGTARARPTQKSPATASPPRASTPTRSSSAPRANAPTRSNPTPRASAPQRSGSASRGASSQPSRSQGTTRSTRGQSASSAGRSRAAGSARR